MLSVNEQAIDAINQAKSALIKGNRCSARYWARIAASSSPDLEEPWLLLAALGSPRASLAYLQQALKIDPSSKRARHGMHWAVERFRKSADQIPKDRQLIQNNIPRNTLTKVKTASLPWAIILTVVAIGLFAWFGRVTPNSNKSSSLNSLSFSGVRILKSSSTPTLTFTPTPTLTPTITPSPTLTSTPTNTETPNPTDTPVPPPTQEETTSISMPDSVVKGERWIDVDLTHQRVYAYQGKNLLNSFIVSTGTWQYPTVTGQYRIYVKYIYANMAGPGYYLPNVPYVMYFYKGYGLHGTYWHNNFGTPMSHGCINLKTEDAGWIFNWSTIGTLVNIHY